MNDDNREMYREQFLRHYGVLGMKWGKRSGNKSTSNTSRKNSSDKPGKKRRMSNKELNSRLKRMKLEQEYEKLAASKATSAKVDKLAKSLATAAALTGSALALYKNLNEMSKLSKK